MFLMFFEINKQTNLAAFEADEGRGREGWARPGGVHHDHEGPAMGEIVGGPETALGGGKDFEGFDLALSPC